MFKMPSNRKLHPQNSRVVNTAIETIKTTAAISQEKYWNAFRVNGYSCSVYNILTQGRICSCSSVEKTNVMKPILDEDGNAPREFIEQMLDGGQIHGVFDYGELPSNYMEPNVKIKKLDTNKSRATTTNINNDLGTPNRDFIEEDYSEDYLSPDISNTTTNKCGICYGSGFVGGFNLCFGNRLVIDSTYPDIESFGYTVQHEDNPNSFKSNGVQAYIQFKVTLPVSVHKVSDFNLKCNVTNVQGTIEASLDKTTFVPLNINNLTQFCIGTPIYIRVSDIETFTHLEIQFVVSSEDTYLEYPIINDTGDISLLKALADVTINVSPKVSSIKSKDIIVDNTQGLIWRVVNVNDHKDRNMNIHGWEVNARLVQDFEIFSNLPINKTKQRSLTTNLNRW